MCYLGRQCQMALSITDNPVVVAKRLRRWLSNTFEINPDFLTRFFIFNAFWGEQPMDVAGVFKLYFAQVAALVPPKGEHHVPIVNADLTKRIHRYEIAQAPAKFGRI